MKPVRVVLAALALGAPAMARDSLGVFEGWGAFRDAQPFRCYAIAEPSRGGGGKAPPFATISYWPGQNIRGQVHVRLSRAIRNGAMVVLSVDDRRITLIAGTRDAWAANPRADASIIAAMRSGRSMSIASVAATGGGFADTYRLRGAATAIDAAALGCARA